jgi:Xaa-Pro aminopeptidase
MAETFQVELSEDEVGIIVDAMEADLEGYVEAAKEARGNNNRADVETFTDAAMRIQKLMGRLQDLIED